jgi:hypothetical protein
MTLLYECQAATGGEDAHFVSTVGGGALGVADGVSGWAEDGVDPADYSRLSRVKHKCASVQCNTEDGHVSGPVSLPQRSVA